MNLGQEKIRIIILVSNKSQQELYYSLFQKFFNDIIRLQQGRFEYRIETPKFILVFIVKDKNADFCGQRCHYYLNLTGDKKFEQEVLIPRSYLGYQEGFFKFIEIREEK